MERRKRISRPIPIIVFGVLFLILPFINYVNFAYQFQIPFTNVMEVLKTVDIVAIFLAVIPFAVGIGILLVKRWGWFLFLGYSGMVLFYNSIVLISEPSELNILTLIQSFVGFSAIFYFLKPDISAPYMKMYGRGWRFQKRKPIEVEISIDGKKLKTKDLSSTGFYVEWIEFPYELNQELKVSFPIDALTLELKAGVVRLDSLGAGIAFRALDNTTTRMIKDWISRQES
ncbi:MAG: PilZ domain-containing protein [Leptospiraceae bacterium]|nr:PilZ domain-containing protein [Leptospiraceae bacterium]